MKNKILTRTLFFLLTSINLSWGGVPSVEGLFRNNNNSDIAGTLILVTMQVSKDFNQNALERSVSEAPVDVNVVIDDPDKIRERYNVKYLFSVGERDKVELLQVIYKLGKMTASNIIDVRYYSNLKRAILGFEERKGLFYSILSTLALNRSQEISSFLKSKSNDFKTNKELVDPEKKLLYEKYRSYLKMVKKDKALKGEIENPMSPKDPELKKKIDAIKARPYLREDGAVQLVKKDSQFIWRVSLDVLDAVFDAKTQRLESIKWGKGLRDVGYSFDEYILFNGNNELPKSIVLDTPDFSYKLRTTSHRQLSLGNKNMRKRFLEYREDFQKNKVKFSPHIFFLK